MKTIICVLVFFIIGWGWNSNTEEDFPSKRRKYNISVIESINCSWSENHQECFCYSDLGGHSPLLTSLPNKTKETCK